MEFDIARAHKLSINYNDLTSLRNHPQALAIPYGDANEYSGRFLPVHCMTHLDKPWNAKPVFQPRENLAVETLPVASKAIVLDFTHKQMILNPHLLVESTDPLADQVAFLDLENFASPERFLFMIQELAITKEELEPYFERLPEDYDLHSTFFLIRTDWSFRFNRYNSSFNNRFLEGQAALLCSPFMDGETVSWLVEQGVRRIGHDLQSLEHPLFYARGGDVHPKVQKARELASDKYSPLNSRVFFDNFLKVDGPLLRNGILSRYYLKNLDLSKLEKPRMEEAAAVSEKTLSGTLLVIPVSVLEDGHGIACEVFFQLD